MMFSVEIRVNAALVVYMYGRRLTDTPDMNEYEVRLHDCGGGMKRPVYDCTLKHRKQDGLLALVEKALKEIRQGKEAR